MPSTTICNQITSLCGATIMNELSVKVAMPSNSVTKSHCVTQHRQGIRKCSGKYRRARYQEMLSSISWAEAVQSQREFVCKEEHEDRIIHTYTGLLCQRVSFPRFFLEGIAIRSVYIFATQVTISWLQWGADEWMTMPMDTGIHRWSELEVNIQ